MEVYKNGKFVVGISYPKIKDKIVLKDTSAKAQKIIAGWKIKVYISSQRIDFISPPEPTEKEIVKGLIDKVEDKDLKRILIYLFEN